MDTTETYIKMCQKAEEIQALRETKIHQFCIEWPFKDGDFLVKEGQKEVMIMNPYVGAGTQRYIWLPRQDQLQEMVFTATAGTYNRLPTKIFAFADYWEENGIPTIFTSLEQLWLAFVMKENYGKIFNGEDWIKE